MTHCVSNEVVNVFCMQDDASRKSLVISVEVSSLSDFVGLVTQSASDPAVHGGSCLCMLVQLASENAVYCIDGSCHLSQLKNRMSHYITVSVPAPRALDPHMPETAVLEVHAEEGYYLPQCGPGSRVSPPEKFANSCFLVHFSQKINSCKSVKHHTFPVQAVLCAPSTG